MSRFDNLKFQCFNSAALNTETMWMKIFVSLFIASVTPIDNGLESISILWVVFLLLSFTKDFVGLDAVAHWFSRYFGVLFAIMLVPQMMVHFLRRELLIALAVLSYMYPNPIPADAITFVVAFIGLTLIEVFAAKFYAVLCFLIMVASPIASVVYCMRTEVGFFQIIGLALGNVFLFAVVRVLLWNYKVRINNITKERVATIPKSRRIAG